jgi:alkanesulfonate monooxygenase SsuD/methylene tetrahydromethanopterin reductase-like flavin-dependent oxidoreductase (luciferase family)
MVQGHSRGRKLVFRCAYGTYLPAAPGSADELREEISLVEAAGLHAIYFSEHHGVAGYAPSPMALAAFALGATTTLRAGAMPLLLPLHHPVRIAEEAALLDFMSGGRLVLGVGAGYLESDFVQIGLARAERSGRLAEGLDLIRNVWSTEPHQHRGRYYTFEPAAPLQHLPVQAGGVPVLVAGSSDAALRLAVRHAHGIVLPSIVSDLELSESIKRYRALLKEDGGGRPGTVAVIRRGWLGDDVAVDHFVDEFGADLRRFVTTTSVSPANWSRELSHREITREMVLERVVLGEPSRAASDLVGWAQRMDVDEVIMKFQWGRRDFEDIRMQLRLAGDLCRRLED